MIRRLTNAQKAGDSPKAIPAGNPAEGRCAAGAVDPVRARMCAIAQAFGGPCIVRTVDGGSHLLTVEGLKFIDISHSSAFSSGAKH